MAKAKLNEKQTVKTQQITFDEIIDFDTDIEKIQMAPHMYISYSQSKGALHLIKEFVNNAVDELTNEHNVGDTIDLYLDETVNSFTCIDNGRGMPFEKMEVACTKLQAGSKFNRKSGGRSAGQNGVGITASNALSEDFRIISCHNGEQASIAFKRGKKVGDLKVEKIKDVNKHGTIFAMVPSPYYLSGDCPIIAQDLINWIKDDLIYMVPSYITINLYIKRKGKEAEIHKKFKNDKGLYDLLTRMTGGSSYTDVIQLFNSTSVVEVIKSEEFNRVVDIELAFAYKRGVDEFVQASFCNFVRTVEGGRHIDAVRSAMVSVIGRKVRESLSEKESKDIDIIPRDITDGLHLAVYLSTDLSPDFTGQTKEKVGNEAITKPVTEITAEALKKYFEKNPRALKKICEFVKVNAKARLSAQKAKSTVIRKANQSPLEQQKIPNLLTANNRGKAYKEILIIEGQSAGGTCADARNTYTQALFYLKGVPKNTVGMSYMDLEKNSEIKQLIIALGCGVGPSFDINKLNYDKIIILTDADIDGHRISSAVCAFFVVHMPEIIRQGKLYRALPPLYKIREPLSKKERYTSKKSEMSDITETVLSRHCEIIRAGKTLNHAEARAFLSSNRGYKEEILRVSESLDIHPEIVEFIALNRKSKDFQKLMAKRFPELTIDIKDKVLEGNYEGRYQILIIDDIFYRKLHEIERFIFEINKGIINYTVIEKKSKQSIDYTLFQLLQLMEKYEPTVLKRFKGLGELQAEELGETTLNPNNRTLLRYTMDDVEEELKKFKILHGQDKSSLEKRKEMMDSYKISRDDLDN